MLFILNKSKYPILYLAILFLFFCFGMNVNASEVSDSVHAIYVGPSIYTVSAHTVEDGESVAVLSRTNENWSLIRLIDGSVGYCKNNLLLITYTEDAEHVKHCKTVQPAKLFTSPEENASVSCVIPANILLTAKSKTEGGFTCVELASGKTGYLLSDTLVPSPVSTAIVRPIPELKPFTGISTEFEAKERLAELSEYFTDGMYWNDYEAGNTSTHKSFALSATPCEHENQGYTHCNFYTSKISEALGYAYGSQCAGYAGLLSDLIFGTEAPIYVHSDFEELRIGDHIRLVLWDHSMLVTDVGKDENGKTFVYVTDVNADYESCRIDWGRKFTQDDLRRLGDYIEIHTRYPETSSE